MKTAPAASVTNTTASPATPSLKASVTALRPETGEVIWKYESPLNIHGRGLAYWPGDEKTAPRLIFATDGGMIMAVAALLKEKSKPTDQDIDDAITNICRCGTFQQVREAIHAAANA